MAITRLTMLLTKTLANRDDESNVRAHEPTFGWYFGLEETAGSCFSGWGTNWLLKAKKIKHFSVGLEED
jgi:hypothetical protein